MYINKLPTSYRMVIGCTGAALLLSSIFFPLFTIPVRGNISLYHDGKIQSIVIVIAVSLALFFIVIKGFNFLWLPDILYILTFWNFMAIQEKKLNDITLGIMVFKKTATQLIHIDWSGWIVGVLGIILLIISENTG